jgi:hypothetical protein
MEERLRIIGRGGARTVKTGRNELNDTNKNVKKILCIIYLDKDK